MSRRLNPNLVDYVVIAISPALIMALVGSLVFFLIEVFYQGEYDMRLTFIMGLFVMAAVLVARIAIEQGKDYALLFAIPLGLVTAMATIRFVEFGGALRSFSIVINLGLIGLIWWCANKLTWDSTVIDEGQDASGEGLLHTVGLEGDSATSANPQHELEGTTSREEPPANAWQRFVKRRHRRHAPGVWIIYFSLAALPIFGFGNWFVPSGDLESRRYVFKLLVVYVAAALGLLLTTSFLGLRRYLRQRRVEMPIEMTATWMGSGGAMILVLLLICSFLPRRNAEYSITDLPFFAGSPSDLWTTSLAVGPEGQLDPENADRTDEGQQGDQQSQGKGDASDNKQGNGQGDSQGNDGSASGDSQSKSGKSGSKGKKSSSGKSGQKSDGDQSEPGDQGGQSSDGKGDEKNSNKNPNDSGGGKQGSQSKSSSKDQKGKQGPTKNLGEKGSSNSDDERQDEKKNSESSGQPKSQRNAGQPRQVKKFNPQKLGSAVGGTIGQLLRLLYWLIVFLVIGFVLWRYHRQIGQALRNFLKSLGELWDSLLGRKRGADSADSKVQAPVGPPPPPFSSFADPFLTGMAEQRSPAEVVRYSFDAFQAWGRERGMTRVPEQTPHEYAHWIGEHESGLSSDARLLADLYCRCAYSPQPANSSNIQPLRRLWEHLRSTPA